MADLRLGVESHVSMDKLEETSGQRPVNGGANIPDETTKSNIGKEVHLKVFPNHVWYL
jgi:hypothetical protein